MNSEAVGLVAGTGKTPSQKLESLAFTFCKVATVALLAGKYTLPVAAICAASLFIAAHVKGQRESRCILRYPLFISGFWIVVFVVWLAFFSHPQWVRALPFQNQF